MENNKVTIDLVGFGKIEELGLKLKGICRSLNAIQVAQEYGPYDSEDYSDGFRHLNGELIDITKNLNTMLDGLTMKEIRTKKEEEQKLHLAR